MQIVICTAYSDHSWEDMLSRLRHSHQWLILKKPFDNIEVLQLASALTEKWRVAEVRPAPREDLETLVELSTYASQRSNAWPADANERLALQTEQPTKRQRRLIRRPATGRLAESPALWRRRRAAPASSAAKPSRPRSRPFAEHVAKAPPGG